MRHGSDEESGFFFKLDVSRHVGKNICMTHHAAAFVDALHQILGPDAVDTSAEVIARYGRNLLPSGDRPPAGVVYPASTEGVQTTVRLANQHRFPLYSISTGENRGLGLKSPTRPGSLIVDVGARMNRILEIKVPMRDALKAQPLPQSGVFAQKRRQLLGFDRPQHHPYHREQQDGPAGEGAWTAPLTLGRWFHVVFLDLFHYLEQCVGGEGGEVDSHNP